MLRRNTDHVQVTHTGSLPRPERLLRVMLARERGEPVDARALEDAVRAAVAEVVERQVRAGITLVNDGEQSKPSYATYMKDRLCGLDGEPMGETVAGFTAGGATADYPEFYARQPRHAIRRPTCNGPVAWRDFAAVERDIANLETALGDVEPDDAFLSAASPGVIPVFLPNRYYPSDDAYIEALAAVMQREYEAIAAAGFTLQLDCPDLAMTRGARTIGEFRDEVARHIEILNHAVRNIAPEQMRLHACCGNNNAPHHRDPELGEIVDLLLTARPAGLSFVAANGRHAHEWALWKKVELPADKIIIPGVVDSTTNIIEHPDAVAERIVRFAGVVGRERVIAGTDCGFGTSVRENTLVDPRVAWSKLDSLGEGARRASDQLWG